MSVFDIFVDTLNEKLLHFKIFVRRSDFKTLDKLAFESNSINENNRLVELNTF